MNTFGKPSFEGSAPMRRVAETEDIPTLSAELERKYPLHGKRAEAVHGDEAQRQEDIMAARREAIQLRLGDTSNADELRREESRLLEEVIRLRDERERFSERADHQRIDAQIYSLEGERLLIAAMLRPRPVQGDVGETAIRPPLDQSFAAK